jgi:hAT family C-terminal dimerisation region
VRAAALSFSEAWHHEASRFPNLLNFCGGIACMMATTAAVESDFSRLRGAKNEYRSSLSCTALEGIMQATELIRIQTIVTLPFDFPRI